jgi:hypothetical protein
MQGARKTARHGSDESGDDAGAGSSVSDRADVALICIEAAITAIGTSAGIR